MNKRIAKQERQRREELAGSAARLALLGSSLEGAWQQFDRLTDPRLIDACVMEINALRCRYDHELSRYKAMERQ